MFVVNFAHQPPKRGASAGVRVGMLRDGRDSCISQFSKLQSLKNAFNVFGRFQSHITKLPCHVLWEILIPYWRFSGIVETDLHTCSVPIVNKSSKVDLRNFEIFKNNMRLNCLDFFLEYLKYPGVSKDRYWFGESWTRPKIPKSWKWWLFSLSHEAE